MGDYWHANPMKYDNYDKLSGIQMEDIIRDKSKKTYLAKYYDIKILYILEKEINEDIELCKELIRVFSSDSNLDDFNSFNYLYQVKSGLLSKKSYLKPYFDRD